MKRISLAILLTFPLAARGQQLAPPQLLFLGERSLFFYEKAAVAPALDLPGAEVRFTLDGSEPNEKSPLAEPSRPVVLTNSGPLKAAAFHPDFQKSEAHEWRFWKLDPSLRPDSAALDNPPSEQYPARAAALFDARSGAENNFSDGNWLGFEGKPLGLRAFFKKKKRVSKVLVSCLVDEGAWIFPPKNLSAQARSGSCRFCPTREVRLEGSVKKGRSVFEIDFEKPVRAAEIRITVEPFGPLPPGHPGTGKPAWLFVDEVFFEK